MSASDEEYQRLFRLQYELIDRLKAESMSVQLVLTGLMQQLSQTNEGKEMVKSAFDFAFDQAIPHATAENTPGIHYATTAVGILEHWRKMLAL